MQECVNKLKPGYYWVIHTWLLDNGEEYRKKMVDLWENGHWQEMPLSTEIIAFIPEPRALC